ncbi:hypothetical protein [Massilia alkalitolerans]|jgi:hypothetical protein|uniref:hypothetical protein n=2 Tax=Massilia TaxID=149698 RepID=UPI00048465CC|nr:hypothetical protein [Massilia alkalitolerans]
MTQPSPFLSRTQLLRSKQVLNSANVSKALSITERSAANLLQRWANEGLVHRTAPGCYMSASAEGDKERLILESLAKSVGRNILLVGASSLRRVGWCDTETLHVAVPLRPSRTMPRVRDTVIYPVGAKVWLQLSKNAVSMDLDKPPLLHPLSQMLWWMSESCPVEMPAPTRMNWGAIAAEKQVQEAMYRHWSEDLEPDFDVKQLYEMLHIDRLTGRTAGRAEPPDHMDLGEDDPARFTA